MRPCPCLLTPGQAPSTNAAREGKHVLPNSFYGNGRTKYPKTAERRLSLGSSSPARKAIWNKQPRSRDLVRVDARRRMLPLLHDKMVSMVSRQQGFWAFAAEEDKPSNPIRVRFFGANAEMLAPDHVFAAPRRIRLKSHIQLAGVLVRSSLITSSDVSTHFRPVLKAGCGLNLR